MMARKFPGVYTTGDSARVDEDGYVWLMGRIDDAINVSGPRLGTAEMPRRGFPPRADGRTPGAFLAISARYIAIRGSVGAPFPYPGSSGAKANVRIRW